MTYYDHGYIIHSNRGLSRIISEINGDFGLKNRKFFHPGVHNAPANGGGIEN